MELEYRISTEHNVYPNLIIEEGYYEDSPDVIRRYRLTPAIGYVFYDTEDVNYRYNPETDEDELITYYYRIAYLIPAFNFANFTYIAVPESEVPADQIYGGVTPPTQTE